MKKENWIKPVKLGAFVLSALLLLVILLYMIGKNRNLFGSQYELRSNFRNISGLVRGNNVRYAGIEVGTVHSIVILNDTTLQVSMLLRSNMKSVIRKNARVSIGSDGLMGNKVIDIIPAGGQADFALPHDLLPSESALSLNDLWPVAYQALAEINAVAGDLKQTVARINNSDALWSTLRDPALPNDIRALFANLRRASDEALRSTAELHQLMADIQDGRGNLGKLIKDSTAMVDLNAALNKFRMVATHTDSAALAMYQLVNSLKAQTDSGKGVIPFLLHDSSVVNKLNNSLRNIEAGTDAFNRDMEALQHNFLLRPYFRKLEKQNRQKED